VNITMKYVDKVGPYFYYRRGGKRWRLHGEPGSETFLKDYQNAAAEFGGIVPLGVMDSFASVVDGYLDSPEFQDLADVTRANYKTYAKPIRQVFGPASIHTIKRRHIKDFRNKIKKRGASNQTLKVIKSIMAWAVDNDIIEVNPTDGIRRFKGGEHLPWPEPLVERFLAEAPPHLVWPVAMGLWTGQRIGIILKARWGDIKDGRIDFNQQKGGEQVWIPILPELEAVLATIPKRSLNILTTSTGRVWKKANFGIQFKRYMNSIDAGEYVFHGLRKKFMEAGAEAGATTSELKSWSGHRSDKMVDHYIKRADRKRLANNLMRKFNEKC